MKIARIVSSNSHIDYVARVIDSLDAEDPPDSKDYGFGEFVSVGLEDERLVGVIYDSRLVNPEYANFGPRLSPSPALENFTPDFINEQGILIGILLIGTLKAGSISEHAIPDRVVPPGTEVETMGSEEIARFHRNEKGEARLKYYPQLIAGAGRFGVPIIRSIIKQISPDFDEEGRRKLEVLSRSLQWQHTFSGNQI
jgi:hypothetical protein